MNKFTGDYVEYDADGIIRVRCMYCGTVVQAREEIPSKLHQNKMVLKLTALSNYQQPIKLMLSNGTYIEPILCANTECLDAAASSNNFDSIMTQVKKGWRDGLVKLGKSQEQLKQHDDKIKDLVIKNVLKEGK